MPEVIRTGHKRKIDLSRAIRDRAIKGMNYTEIALKNNCTPQAARQALKPLEKILLSRDNLKEFRDKEVSLIDSVKMKVLVAAIQPDKIKKSSTLQLTTAYSQLTDKSLLLQGKATQIIESKSMVLQAHKTLEEIQERLKSAQIIDGETDNSIVSVDK